MVTYNYARRQEDMVNQMLAQGNIAAAQAYANNIRGGELERVLLTRLVALPLRLMLLGFTPIGSIILLLPPQPQLRHLPDPYSDTYQYCSRRLLQLA